MYFFKLSVIFTKPTFMRGEQKVYTSVKKFYKYDNEIQHAYK